MRQILTTSDVVKFQTQGFETKSTVVQNHVNEDFLSFDEKHFLALMK